MLDTHKGKVHFISPNYHHGLNLQIYFNYYFPTLFRNGFQHGLVGTRQNQIKYYSMRRILYELSKNRFRSRKMEKHILSLKKQISKQVEPGVLARWTVTEAPRTWAGSTTVVVRWASSQVGRAPWAHSCWAEYNIPVQNSKPIVPAIPPSGDPAISLACQWHSESR
jgi:hypothetical protein